jgi:hypothetical protein
MKVLTSLFRRDHGPSHPHVHKHVFMKRFPISTNLINIFHSAYCHLVSSLLAKSVVEQVLVDPLKAVQEKLTQRLLNMAIAFKKLVYQFSPLLLLTLFPLPSSLPYSLFLSFPLPFPPSNIPLLFSFLTLGKFSGSGEGLQVRREV